MRRVTNARLADHNDSTLYSLIGEVQKYRFLYDIEKHQRSAAELVGRRTEVWNEIGHLFGLDPAECLSLWNRLRNTFTKYFRVYQYSKNTSQVYNPTNWKYFESLLFLIPYVEFRGQQSPIADTKNDTATYTQATAKTLAKKAIKRSKNILLKTREPLRGTIVDSVEDESNFNITQLIDLVKQHPVIYEENPSWVKGKELSFAWQSVSNSMGYPVSCCLKKWRSLWTNLRKSSLRPDSDKWKWFSYMKEFIPYQEARARYKPAEEPNKNKMDTSDSMESGNEQDGHLEEAVENNVGMNAWSSEPSNEQVEPAYDADVEESQHTAMTPQSNSSSLNYKSPQQPSTSVTPAEPKYSEYYFGMCVAQMMEDVPKPSRPLLKAKILQTVAAVLQ